MVINLVQRFNNRLDEDPSYVKPSRFGLIYFKY